MQVGLAPLPAENHVCDGCGFSYSMLSVEAARVQLWSQPHDIRAAVLSIPEGRARRRPEPGTWSVLEYACHIRDVYATTTIRLHRAVTESLPVLEPMFNDLRAMRFRYNERDVAGILGELEDNARGFDDEIAAVAEQYWDRQVMRLADEFRSARWLVRHAVHEGAHHLGDIRRVADRVSRAHD